MPTYQEYLEMADKADRAGNANDARDFMALAQGAPRAGKGERLGVAGALTQGLAELPMASQKAMEATGLLGIGEAPISEFIEEKTGISMPRLPEYRKPETLPEYAAQGVGQTAAALLPFGAVAKGLQGAGGLTGQIAKPIMETMARRPVTTMASEVLAGAGAGAALRGAQELPDFPGRDVVAQLLGGLGGAFSPSLVTQGPAAQVARGVWRGTKSAVLPFTKSGALPRAQRRVQGAAQGDPATLLRSLHEESVGGLSPAQRTGDPGLLALERSILDTDPKLAGRFAEKTQEATQTLRKQAQQAGRGGDIGETRGFIEGRRERLVGRIQQRKEAGIEGAAEVARSAQEALKSRGQRILSALDTRLKQAGALAEQRIEKVAPRFRRAEASRIVREEVEDALVAARAQERELWGAVPDAIKVPTSAAKEAYKVARNSLSKSQAHHMPKIATRWLSRKSKKKWGDAQSVKEVNRKSKKKWGDTQSVKEVNGLRSELLEVARLARSEGKFNQARVADDIADGLLADLNSVGDVSAPLTAARDFSQTLNETFKQGGVGKLLGYAREGGRKVAPDLALEGTVGRGGLRGDVELQAIGRAVEDSPHEAMGAIQDYMKGMYARAVGERFDPARARKFISDNQEILDRFPSLRREMTDAESAQSILNSRQNIAKARSNRVEAIVARESKEIDRLSKAAEKRIEALHAGRIKALENPNKSHAARFLNSPVDREVATMLKARDPGTAALQLRSQAAKDKTGRATKGLKAGLIDHLIGKAGTRQFAESGEEILSGRALTAQLKDRRTRTVINVWLKPDEVNRLHRIADELSKLEMARGAGSAGPVMQDVPGTILSYATRVLAARSGAQMGGGTSGASLLTAGMASQRVKALLGKLTNDRAAEMIKDAIDDPKLYRALLMPIKDSPINQNVVNQRLHAWLGGVGSRLLETEDPDNP